MDHPVTVELDHHQHYRHSLGRSSPFFSALAEGRLLGSACTECGRVFVPPRSVCGIDRAPTNWTEVSDRGTVVVSTDVARRPAYAAPGPDPLSLGLIQLDGVATAVLAEIVGTEPMMVGMRVRAAYRSPVDHPTQHLTFVADEPTGTEAITDSSQEESSR